MNKGFCRYGSSCRFEHVKPQTDNTSQHLPIRQNVTVMQNASYEKSRSGYRVPQAPAMVQNPMPSLITDVTPRIFPPSICEEYYYTSNCRFGERCRDYHIFERQLFEISNSNKMGKRNEMNQQIGMMQHHQHSQQQQPQQQHYQYHSQEQHKQEKNQKPKQNPTSKEINPSDILAFFKEKTIAEIHSYTVDNLSNFTPEIEEELAEIYSNRVNSIDYQKSVKEIKMTLLSYFNVLKLLIGRYNNTFLEKMNFKIIRSFITACLSHNIEINYIIILYSQLLESIRQNPMKIDSEKSENENKKMCEEYIEKFGNRLCGIYYYYCNFLYLLIFLFLLLHSFCFY